MIPVLALLSARIVELGGCAPASYLAFDQGLFENTESLSFCDCITRIQQAVDELESLACDARELQADDRLAGGLLLVARIRHLLTPEETQAALPMTTKAS